MSTRPNLRPGAVCGAAEASARPPLRLVDARDVNLAARAIDFAPPRKARPDLPARLQRSLDRSRSYARRALAESTVERYSDHWQRFVDWCDENEIAALPADPEAVAAHLSELADGELDDLEQLVLDEHGAVVCPPLATSTITVRLAAINKAHEVSRLERPGDDAFCKQSVRGIRHTLGVRARHRRDALTLALLRRVLEQMEDATRRAAARDVAFVLVGNHPRLGPAVLAKLDWERVTLTAHEVAIRLYDGDEDLPGRTVTLRAHEDPALCPVRALAELRSLGSDTGALFASRARGGRRSGAHLSDVAVLRAVRRAGVLAGIGERRSGRPWSDGELRAVVSTLRRPTLRHLRDRALLLTGFVGAVRRSNLAAFTWSDFHPVPEGLVVLLRRSKTDQLGQGFEIFLPYGENPLTCPVRAWEAWRDAVCAATGASLENLASEPCFIRLDAGNRTFRDEVGRLVQVSDETVNDVVAKRARQAGLVGNFGGHSLRAGFVTTLAELGVPIHEIAEQTGHKSLDVLRAYIRPIEARLTSPAWRLRDAEALPAPRATARSGDAPRRFVGSRSLGAVRRNGGSDGRGC